VGLPEPTGVEYPDSGFRTDEHALALWAAHGYDTGGEPYYSADQLHSYASRKVHECRLAQPQTNVYKAYNSWPKDIRDKLSLHDLRRMNGWQSQSASEADVAALAEEIAKAVSQDENAEGCDISGGLFGKAMSALIRRIAQRQGEAVLARPARVGGRDYLPGDLVQQVVGRAHAEYNRHHRGDAQQPASQGRIEITDESIHALCRMMYSRFGSLWRGSKENQDFDDAKSMVEGIVKHLLVQPASAAVAELDPDPPDSCGYQGYEFGAGTYPDSVCIEGRLHDADNGPGDGQVYLNDEDIPCPMCRPAEAVEWWTERNALFVEEGETEEQALARAREAAISLVTDIRRNRGKETDLSVLAAAPEAKEGGA